MNEYQRASNRHRRLKGSQSLDQFKYLHKQKLPKTFYSLDVDLLWVEKYPEPHVVAAIDYKRDWDGITFTECMTFNLFLEQDVPVYIVVGDEATARFTVRKYLGGDYLPEPPEVFAETILEGVGWEVIREWQGKIRKESRKRVMVKRKGFPVENWSKRILH